MRSFHSISRRTVVQALQYAALLALLRHRGTHITTHMLPAEMLSPKLNWFCAPATDQTHRFGARCKDDMLCNLNILEGLGVLIPEQKCMWCQCQILHIKRMLFVISFLIMRSVGARCQKRCCCLEINYPITKPIEQTNSNANSSHTGRRFPPKLSPRLND